MNNLGSKSQLTREYPPALQEIARGEQRNNSQFAIEEHLNHNPLEFLAVQSQILEKRMDDHQTDQYKRQLLRLMTLVKLESIGYSQRIVAALIELQLNKLKNLNEISSPQFDEVSSIAADQVVLTVLGENGVKLLLRESSHQRRSVNNQHNIPPKIEHQQEKKPLPQIICSICYLLTARYNQQPCGHSFCQDCMRGYINQSTSNGSHNIQCPEYQCEQMISIKTIQNLLPPKEFERFLYFKDKNQKEMNPDNKFCHQPDCGELLTKSEDALTCPKCKSTYCQICLQGYHKGRSCDIVLKNALQTTFSAFKIKKCPKCKSPIQKISGCNHMSCKKCQFQFCWLCLGEYSKHHYRYYNCCGCPGMQYEEENEFVAGRLKQILLYIVAPFFLILLFTIFLLAMPFYMIGCLIYQPCAWISQGTQLCEVELVHFICCCEKSDCTNCKVILWFVLQPRAIGFALFMAPIKIASIFCRQLSHAID